MRRTINQCARIFVALCFKYCKQSATKNISLEIRATYRNIVGEYQCGFRKKRATTDQVFLIWQILKEYQIKLHHFFVDYKQAYDSLKRQRTTEIMEEFSLPRRLVILKKKWHWKVIKTSKVYALNIVSVYCRTWVNSHSQSCQYYYCLLYTSRCV